MRAGLFLSLCVLVLAACSAGEKSGAPEPTGPEPTAAPSADETPASASPVRVFVARKILTMDPLLPEATAVAVVDGRIEAVGSLATLTRALVTRPHDVDRSFENKVLMPGLIEPHLHPYIAGVLLPMEFITPHDWDLLDRQVEGVRGREAYLARLAEVESGLPEDEWLWTWGYHQYFHGALARADLDAISSTRPIIVWHRSFHEIYANSAALAAMQVDAEQAAAHPQVDLETGHFFETGLLLAVAPLLPRLMDPERYVGGLRLARRLLHAAGITSIMDGAFGTLDLEKELQLLQAAGWDSEETPFRTVLLADGRALGDQLGHERAMATIAALPARSTHRLRFPEKAVKLFADGAFYSQLMQMRDGYTDGHHGEWIMTPEALETAARPYWRDGWQINVHVNGDAGVDVVLDILERLQGEHPREDHRFALHHFGYSTVDQADRIRKLGAIVSANPYYLWALGDKYSEVGLGPERAAYIVRAGSLVERGIPLSFHSDFTMAPARPLLLAWVAVTRRTADGNVLGEEEKISVDAALRAVTIDAAHLMRMEDRIGSIEPGKIADFTVLDEDPTAVPVERLKDVGIWGTVFEGVPHRVSR